MTALRMSLLAPLSMIGPHVPFHNLVEWKFPFTVIHSLFSQNQLILKNHFIVTSSADQQGTRVRLCFATT
jgi:hypothetical protein